MKKSKMILMILISVTLVSMGQIPNGGFEEWLKIGNYENPSGVWTTFNSYSSGNFYPVTKSSDHYPASVGNYSIRLENNIAISVLPPPNHAPGLGMAYTTNNPNQIGLRVAFPISGHPNSICGYFKFIPQNNDTMCIILLLYKDGISVSQLIFTETAAKSDWSSFKIPIPSYMAADSASIQLASFYAFPNHYPRGNSVLFVDNLSFDELITSVSVEHDEELLHNYSLKQNYPNPFNPSTTIEYEINRPENVKINVYDVTGKFIKELVNEHSNTGKYSIVWNGKDNAGNMVASGNYFYQIISGGFVHAKKMILLK